MTIPTPAPPAADIALALTDAAGARALALAAGEPNAARAILGTLLAHELATGHRLLMRVAAKADGFIDRIGAETGSAPDRAGLEAARLSGIVARLMERYRRGLLALAMLRDDPKAADLRPAGKAQAGSSDPVPDVVAPSTMPPPSPEFAQPASPRRGRLRHGNPSGDFAAAPRCGARTRDGVACRQPAMANGRCRFHGGRSTGPRTAAGRAASARAHLRHGADTRELVALRSAAAASSARLAWLAVAGRASLAGHGVEPANRSSSREGSPEAEPQPTRQPTAPSHAAAGDRLAGTAAFAGPLFDPPAVAGGAIISSNEFPPTPSAPAAISALALCRAPIHAHVRTGAASAKERLA